MTSHRTHGARRALLSLLAVSLVPAAAAAQELPPARQLVDRYIEAIGGREAILARTSTHTTGTFAMPAMGLTGDLEVYSADPGRQVTKVNISGIGEIRTGFDGEVAWSLNPMEGPRVFEGKELAQAKDEAAPESTLRDPALVESLETVEKTSMNGQDCYRVRVVWKSGRETFDCYSVETGLIVALQQKNESPMGAIDVTVLVNDYKDFGGLRLPTRLVQQMMGAEQVLTITSVSFDAVDPSVFELPAEIRALVNK
jgi:hypothetical protein